MILKGKFEKKITAGFYLAIYIFRKTKLVGRVVTGEKIRSVYFMPVIAFDSFQISKTKLKVALVDILKQFPEYFSYLSSGNVDV